MSGEMICRRTGGGAREKGYRVRFTYDGIYEVMDSAGRLVKGGFVTEGAAWHWADEWVRLGDG